MYFLPRRRLPHRRSRPRIGARITGRTDRVGAHREISDISEKSARNRSREIYLPRGGTSGATSVP